MIINWYKYQWENQTKIIIIVIMSTYSVQYWRPLPNVIPVSLASNLTRITKKRHSSMRGQRSVVCQRHISRTSYHARTGWLQYRINLITKLSVDFQQKTNIALKYWLEPKIILGFSAFTRYAVWCLFCVVSFLCVLEINLSMETQ